MPKEAFEPNLQSQSLLEDPPTAPPNEQNGVRKYAAVLKPGRNYYDLVHGFGTEDVIVQTRIAGNIREGGISIVDENTVRIGFGGPLHEPMNVVIIG